MERGSTEADPFTLFKEKLNPSIPIFIISRSDPFSVRLDAVRAGGKAFFLKPLNVADLVDVLDDYSVAKTPSSPYRVLIIDDSQTQAFYSSVHLQKIGISTEIINDPSKVLQVLTDFNPDLILLDIFMPECSGLEVANIIRQIKTFDSIPIVYLYAETDINIQLEAMGIGGDDFLTKPIKPEHLRSAVLSRAERYRKLRSLMIKDGLTGLLNNSAVNEQLKQEIIRADRQINQVSYVMIDLDKFKLVNDSYGHAMGDRVLKSLARLFKQRLRRSDIIGRYGGEEFAIIFPDTSGQAAVGVMDELRKSFALVQHKAGDKEFTVIFIVVWQVFQNTRNLLKS
ncbi:MAG: diguanylate cyclase, partial [Anaerolineaceae bacterium]|nr:diguanylate cyclase [Anaerolineaceae bacterium]